MSADETRPDLADLVRLLIAGRTYGNVSVAALLVALTTTEGACVCGKPSSHIEADEDSDEWACLVPVRP